MRTALLTVLLLTSACASSQPAIVACRPQGCAALDKPDWVRQELLEHAERDLSCAPAQLTVTEVEAPIPERALAKDSIVSGCGYQARYAWAGDRWVLDSAITTAAR
jgi:hypothetical protein